MSDQIACSLVGKSNMRKLTTQDNCNSIPTNYYCYLTPWLVNYSQNFKNNKQSLNFGESQNRD